MQQDKFDDFVKEIIHPAGFIMFSDLQVKQILNAKVEVVDAIVSGPTVPLLVPDNYYENYTGISVGNDREGDHKKAIGPDTGTLESSW